MILLGVALVGGSFAQRRVAKEKDLLDVALAFKAEALATAGNGFMSGWIKKGDVPVVVDYDLSGAKELVLITSGGADGTNSDHALWGEAVLVDANGKETRLEDVEYKVRNVEGGWFRKGTNFGGAVFSLGKGDHRKTYKHGVIAHANSLLVVDIAGKGYKTFKANIGIDNGSGAGSAYFMVVGNSGIEQAKKLREQMPNVDADFVPYIGGNLEMWLVTKGNGRERGAVEACMKKMKNSAYFAGEIAKIETLKDPKSQVEAYVALNKRAQEILNLQSQIKWLNPKAVEAAYSNFSKMKGYDKAWGDAKMAQFRSLMAFPLDGVYNMDFAAIERAHKALVLSKEILMSNPLVAGSSIMVTKYNLGDRSRSAMAPSLGTQPNNWSCQLSGRRNGFDAELVELSNLGGEIKERSIYKPNNGGILTDAMLHWNGENVLFTSTDDRNRFQVYEVGVNGGQPKQVTNAKDQDLEFFDATYLPSGKIVVASNVGYHGVPCVNGSDVVGNYSLYDPSTNEMRRLTFDQDNNWNATVLKNGKVMYTRWEYTDLMHYYSRIVFTMNPDGTQQKALFGSGAMFPNSTFDMQQLPQNGNRFIGVISGHHGIARSGRLIIFDPTKARKGVEGMIQEIPHSSRPIVPLVKDELVNGVWPQFIKPHPLSDEYFFVAAKLDEESLWGIYLVDIYDNVTLVAQTEGVGYINPVPMKKRETPALIRETVPMSLQGADKEATVFIQDIYEGEGLKDVPRGTVKEFRVLAYEFAYIESLSDHVNNGIQSGWDIKRELGRVKVEADGSAIFKIPANLPVSLQPLDSTGAAVQLMRSWFVGMPGEIVSCVGCHEDQNMIAKPNRSIASKKKPDVITTPEGGVRPFTFELEIQPILDRACIACHDGEKKAGGIDYTKGRMKGIGDWAGTRYFSESYLAFHPYFYRQGPEAEMAVLNPYEYNVANSEMIQMLRNGHHGVKLTDKEWERLITWVDFNLPYSGVMNTDSLKQRFKGGEVCDQYQRRRDMSIAYSNTDVDWKKEVADYAATLKAKGTIKPEMPTSFPVKKEIKAKAWAFGADKAKEMQGGKAPKTVDLGGGITMTFVWVPAGSFIAGGNGLNGTLAPYKAKINKGFWMAEKEVSNEQMRALMEHDSRYIGQQWKDHTTPGYNVDSAQYPATKVSWEDAQKFVGLMAQKSGLKVALPNEVQWEWAARAGSDGDFWYGTLNDDFGKYENMADETLNRMAVSGIDPKPMSKDNAWFPFQAYIPKDNTVSDGALLMRNGKGYLPNAWGLYDMHGNVAEWTVTPGEGHNYVVKGGSWYDRAKRSTASTRKQFLKWHKVYNVGFRPIIAE